MPNFLTPNLEGVRNVWERLPETMMSHATKSLAARKRLNPWGPKAPEATLQKLAGTGDIFFVL